MNAAKFMNNANGVTGDKVQLPTAQSPLTKLRRKGYKTIKQLASARGLTDLDIAITVLGGEHAALARYVQSKGIVPATGINQLIAQAAMCRMKDIGQTALIFNISDADALKELEEAESVAFEIGTADIDNVLNPTAQAALIVVMDEILRKSKKASGASTAKTFVKALSGNEKGSGDYKSDFNVNNLLQKNAPANTFDDGRGGANYESGGTPKFDINQPGVKENAAAANTSSVTDWINTIVGSFTKIVDAFKTGGGVVKDTIDTVKDSASDVGADSISKFFDKYKWWFIGGLLIILVIVLIAVYARRK